MARPIGITGSAASRHGGLIETVAEDCRRFRANRLLIENKASGHDASVEMDWLHTGSTAYEFVVYGLRNADGTRPAARVPLGYDVHKKAWYDVAAGNVRHFLDHPDEALPWTDRLFTFNTTCFNCHVSQLSTTYDLATDTYHTTWTEAGISCESCHGPGGDTSAPWKPSARDRRRGSQNHPHQGLHAPTDERHMRHLSCQDDAAVGEVCRRRGVLRPLRPGDAGNPDFYPDGRDLGENYTYTSWLMSPCAKSGKLDCNHCHTPSGRFRFAGEKSNQACLPCHETICCRSGPARPPQGRKPGQRVRRLPHADDAVCRDGPQRPLDAAAHAGSYHGV